MIMSLSIHVGANSIISFSSYDTSHMWSLIKNDTKEEKQSTMPVENSENIGKSEDNNQETNSGK